MALSIHHRASIGVARCKAVQPASSPVWTAIALRASGGAAEGVLEMDRNRPANVAAPTNERDWEVRGGNWDRVGGGHLIGYIAEVGGVYEVEKLTGVRVHEYCATFKEAMERFEEEG